MQPWTPFTITKNSGSTVVIAGAIFIFAEYSVGLGSDSSILFGVIVAVILALAIASRHSSASFEFYSDYMKISKDDSAREHLYSDIATTSRPPYNSTSWTSVNARFSFRLKDGRKYTLLNVRNEKLKTNLYTWLRLKAGLTGVR